MTWARILFGFDKLLHPWFLLLLAAVAALLVAECLRRPPGAVGISTGETLAAIRGRGSRALQVLPALLRAAGLTLLVVALARPMAGIAPRAQRADIVDIMLCVDVSGSMKAMDFSENGQMRDRLHVTKLAVGDFIESRKFRPGDRFGIDRIGLVLYAGYAWTQTPLTLDYGVLANDLDQARIEERDRAKAGTAIGSAVGLAVSRLIKSEAKSRVIILLTDGLNNAGELDPMSAARIAKDYGIRIYTIGAGSGDEVMLPVETMFGPQLRRAHIPMDEEVLERIADTTGGRYFRARDTRGLQQAYREIDKLEATEIEVGEAWDYQDAFFPWALMGGLLSVASMLGRRMWFDPIP
jgi:Ca-activated chloride channel homolog